MTTMKSYFDEVVDTLTNEDSTLLGLLIDQGATAKFTAVANRSLQESAGLSEAKFRKIVTRLTAQRFVESNADYKEHALYITPYGHAALQKVLNMVEVACS